MVAPIFQVDLELDDESYTRALLQAIADDDEYVIQRPQLSAEKVASHVSASEALTCIDRMVMMSAVWRAVLSFDALPSDARGVFEDALRAHEVPPVIWKKRWPTYVMLFVYLRACARDGVTPPEDLDDTFRAFFSHYEQNWISSDSRGTSDGMREALKVIPEARLARLICDAERFQPTLALACLTPEVIDKLVAFIGEFPAKPDFIQGYQHYRLSGIYRKGADRQPSHLTPHAATLAPAFSGALQTFGGAPQRGIFIWTLVDAARAGSEDGFSGLAAALGDKSKPTRALVVDELRKLDAERVRAHVTPRLSARKKATREAAQSVVDALEA